MLGLRQGLGQDFLLRLISWLAGGGRGAGEEQAAGSRRRRPVALLSQEVGVVVVMKMTLLFAVFSGRGRRSEGERGWR